MSANGQLSISELRGTVIGGQLRPAPSRDADRLALAFAEEFGRSLRATDTYRTLAEQQRLYKPPPVGVGPGFAAVPGTSNHGTGQAIDFASRINVAGSVEHRWMNANGPRFGWIWPEWAQQARRFEPWHREHMSDEEHGRHVINRPKSGQVGLGSSSSYVASLQRFLNHMFGDKPQQAVDGDYGMATYAAVRRFQRRVDLAPVGVIGPVTKERLHHHGFGTGK